MSASSKFFALMASAMLVFSRVGGATPVAADEPSLVSYEQMAHWIANTDAELTFVGAPLNPLLPRSAQNTIVTFCTTRQGSTCGGACTIYNGPATCVTAVGTNCLSATNNVQFCSTATCNSPCNSLSTCGVRLDNGFCFTPNTNSILVSTA